MKKSGFFLLVLFSGLLSLAILPSPSLAYQSPGKPTGFVNDFTGTTLNVEQKSYLENKLVQFEQTTSNEISVVIIKSLNGDTTENFAEKLFQEWGIGKEKEDNGILLLVALEDRKMRIEVGYGLEGSLTDLLSSRIIRETLTPAFQASDFYGGINTATDQIIQIVAGKIPENLQQEKGANFNFDWLFFILFIPIWLASILSRSKSWWAGGILGGIVGIVFGFVWGFLYFGLIAILGLTLLGLLFDFLVSKAYSKSKASGIHPPWWSGGGGRGSGGFGGFSGGSSGGGGSSGSW